MEMEIGVIDLCLSWPAAPSRTHGSWRPQRNVGPYRQRFSNITEPSNRRPFSWIAIDLLLAADNAIIVGRGPSLPPDQRRKVIIMGVLAALVLRIAFALVVVRLMSIIGLIFIGGLPCSGSHSRCGASCAASAASIRPDRPRLAVTSIRAEARQELLGRR